MTDNNNISTKNKILDYAKENKLKIVIIGVVVVLIVVFAGKKDNKKQVS